MHINTHLKQQYHITNNNCLLELKISFWFFIALEYIQLMMSN